MAELSDPERLDWLETTGASVHYRVPLPEWDLSDELRQAFWDRPFVVATVKGLGWVGATLRDAIDKAMAEAESDAEVDRVCRDERIRHRHQCNRDGRG